MLVLLFEAWSLVVGAMFGGVKGGTLKALSGFNTDSFHQTQKTPKARNINFEIGPAGDP